MTSATSATARHLRVVGDTVPGEGPEPGGQTPVVGYVVLVPEGTDPTELFTADGTRVRFRPLLPADGPLDGGEDGPTGAPVAGPAPASASAPEARQEPAGEASVQPPVPHHSAPQPSVPQQPAEAANGLLVDPERHIAQADDEQLDLTYLEFELLAHFVQHPHRVHTRAHLVSALWGYSHVGDGRTVDVHVARLRRKLGRFRETIVTVRRVGYKFEPSRAR
ncbi:transcriptional regulator [Streptomyces sp. Amel2xB2]|uniref:winged helix-turn-helix domain-containing protein n=1 Tax=Streptomyces sp. Amel2xB2 TaxID=1305829 RepID=UPI000DBF4A98|nr:winged helix-turn-helix domain-containing protein [Streptomyces sp. Amel2xB2]RAJ55728.1 transcriptional regulator [Streptomyces sp. Amel2xB2]